MLHYRVANYNVLVGKNSALALSSPGFFGISQLWERGWGWSPRPPTNISGTENAFDLKLCTIVVHPKPYN